ncbi:RAMP superfamily CRISPR-associated protein [Streptomyces sp. NPDC002896]|uniref:RAMP superfamily CRISPR-associated protein n=1 Tax=Streptomyces sp. NPDC002896 TaxID=3154438 RepID=UPI00331EDCE4
MLFAQVEFELIGYAAVGAPERKEPGSTLAQPVARDGWGNPWIPPTSLAGSLRAHLGEEAGKTLMGEEDPDEEEAQGRPSVVRFLGTELRLPDSGLAYRTQTAVDRHRAAARATTLRTGEYLPPGTRILCQLRVDGAAHHDAVLAALRSWEPLIGGGRSTGHGTTRTIAIHYDTIDLDTREGRRIWLTRGGPELFTGTRALDPDPTPRSSAIRTEWEIVDALHIGSGVTKASEPRRADEDRAAEPAPLLRDHQGRPYVPGTTWKGLLRSRCEFILGSLGLAVCDGGPDTCGHCMVCTSFGWSGDGQGEAQGKAESVGLRSRLRFGDSPLTDARVEVRNHVALDRVFGGAGDGLLFAEEVAETGRLTLEVYEDGEVHPAVRAALRLALHDLHAGAFGIGGGTTRGYGTLRRVDADAAALEAERTEAMAVLAAHLDLVQEAVG